MFRALGSASGDFTHDTVGTICYWHWVLHFVISHTKQGVRFVTGIIFCILRDHGSASGNITHETGAMICYGHWVLRLVISHTKNEVRCLIGIVFCILPYHTRDRGYDLLRALGSASFNITHGARGTVCYRHCVLHLLISRKKQRGYDFVAGVGISHTRQRVRFVTGIGLCFFYYHSRDKGYDWLRVLCSASSDIPEETAGVRLVAGVGFCVL